MKKILLFFGILSALCFTSCKPTEKGYKAAYDAAQNKREAVQADVRNQGAISELQEIDGARLQEVDGVKVYVLNRIIRPIEETDTLKGQYNVAVGSYKMATNSKAQAADLRKEHYDALAVKDAEGMYYTVAGSFPSLSEAVKFYDKYRTGKDRAYVGLPKAPVIIYTPRTR